MAEDNISKLTEELKALSASHVISKKETRELSNQIKKLKDAIVQSVLKGKINSPNIPSGGGGGDKIDLDAASGKGGKKDDITSRLDRLLVSPSKMLGAYGLGSLITDMDALLRRSYAINQSIADQTLPDIVKIARYNGLGIEDLGNEIASLREEGLRNLNKNTIGLIARFKLTDQNTGVLIKFLGETAGVLRLNNQNAVHFAETLNRTAAGYNQRADSLIELANGLAKTFEMQSAAGGGQGLVGAFSTLAAKLGEQSKTSVDRLAKLLADTSKTYQMDALGVSNQIEKLYTSRGTDSKALESLVLTVDSRLKEFQGTGRAGTMAFQSAIEAFGGDGLLAIQELAIKLRESNVTMSEMRTDLVSLKSINASLKHPFELLGRLVSKMTATLNQNIAPALVSYGISAIALAATIRLLTRAVTANTVSNKISGWVSIVASLALAVYDYANYGKESVDELKKIEKNGRKETGLGAEPNLQSGLVSLLSQVANRINTNTSNRESMEIQRETLMELKKQTANSDPSRGAPSPQLRQVR